MTMPGEAPGVAYANLAAVVPPEQAEATTDFLQTLSAYMIRGQYAFGGSIARNLQAARKGHEYQYGNDGLFEVNVAGIDTIDPMIHEDFLISHHHRAGSVDFYLQFVHPETGFTASVKPMTVYRGAEVAMLQDCEVPVLSAEAMLADTVWEMRQIFAWLPVSADLFNDAYALHKIADENGAEAAWQELLQSKLAEVRATRGAVPLDLLQLSRLSLANTSLRARNRVMEDTRLLAAAEPQIGRPAGLDCRQCPETGYLRPSQTPAEIYRAWGLE